jgi:hypothetical protein
VTEERRFNKKITKSKNNKGLLKIAGSMFKKRGKY